MAKQDPIKLPAAEQALAGASTTKDEDLTPQQKAAKTRAKNKAAADLADAEQAKDAPSIMDTDTKRPRGDLPTVEVEEEPVDLTPVSPWKEVHELTDEELKIEAVNIFGYQFRMCLLRIRVDGRLTGQIIPVEKTIYHPTKGFQQNK